MTTGSIYRPEIDGLRAVAIISVVLHHYGVPGFAGGFVGVDIFFVISGFLITEQLRTSANFGGISLLEFYERRARRILPALLALLLTLLLGGALILPADDLLREAKNALTVLLFASNVRYLGQTGYFDESATEQLLLHTWSLAVEEQFYLVFPVILILLSRWPRATNPLFWLLALLSLGVSAWLVRASPNFAFYMLPTRAWELLVGALLAVGAFPELRANQAKRAVAWTGVAMIVFAVLQYDENVPFPGLAAALPVVGALAILHSAAGTRVAGLLGSPVAVGVGLISYSLYLWHWPILLLSKQYLGDLGGVQIWVAGAGSIGLAYLSWRFVEKPLRNRSKVSVRCLVFISVAGSVVVASLAVALIAVGGWTSRNASVDAWYAENAAKEQAFQNSPCLNHDSSTIPPVATCIVGETEQSYRMVVWGDSHALHWRPLFEAAGKAGGFGVRMITKAGCPPFPVKAIFPRDQSRRNCPEFNAAVLDHLAQNPTVETVVLAANWQGVIEGHLRLSETDSRPAQLAESLGIARSALQRTIGVLHAHGKKVVIIGQTPIPVVHPVRCVGRRLMVGLDTAMCETTNWEDSRSRDQRTMRFFGGLKLDGYVSPFAAFCDSGVCRMSEDGRLYYIDAAHLSSEGAMRLRPAITRLSL